MKLLSRAFGFVVLLLGGCDPSSSTKAPAMGDLSAGGVYIAYNLGCEEGCSSLQKGDLVLEVDGKPATTAADLDGLVDGQPHAVVFLHGGERGTVQLRATPKQNMPPLTDTPPLWAVGAEELDRAPAWARRRMFGHASPSVMLVSSDGGLVDGRQLFGKKRLIVYWDWGDREEEAAAVDFMQVLQKASTDLSAREIEVMFVHVRFPNGRKAPMNDSDLRAWQAKWSLEAEGGVPLPFYRYPNETEFNAARELGMENAFTVIENLGQSPTIVLLNERGIVRWHSEGVMDPAEIGSKVPDREQATIIEAITFSLEKL